MNYWLWLSKLCPQKWLIFILMWVDVPFHTHFYKSANWVSTWTLLSCSHHMSNPSLNLPFTTQRTSPDNGLHSQTETHTHIFITSLLDYCNSVLFA